MSILANFLAEKRVTFIAVAAPQLTFRTACDGAHSGQVDNTLSAYQGDTRVGYIQYSVYQDKPSVNYIKVEPEFRRQKIGTKLLQQLQREFPDTELELGGLTDAGAALHKSLPTSRTENPRVHELKAELDDIQNKLDSYSKLADAHRNKADKTDADYEQFIKSVEDWNELSDRADDIKHELATMPTGKTLISTAAEEIPETITVDGKDRPTTNSKGQKIHPTLKGIENFWRWFGASSLVDDHGRPRVFLHGTKANFDTFEHVDSENRVSGIDPTASIGYHFTEDPGVAGKFADGLYLQKYEKAGGSIMPVYLKATSILKTTETEMVDAMSHGDYSRLREVEYAVGNYVYENDADEDQVWSQYENNSVFRSGINKSALDLSRSQSEDELDYELAERMASEYREQALRSGHDAIEYRNDVEGGTSWIMFESNQIKSATGNSGEFSNAGHAVTAHYKVLQSLALGSCVDGVNMTEDEPFYGKPVEFFQSALASYEATAVSKKDKLKEQAKADRNKPVAAPQGLQPRVILTDPRVYNVKGLLPDVVHFINTVQDFLVHRKSADFIRSQQIAFRGSTRSPKYNILSVRDDLKGCEYLKFADDKANKHWRVYFAVGQNAVQILDIFDKDDNAISKQETERLVSRMRAFRNNT